MPNLDAERALTPPPPDGRRDAFIQPVKGAYKPPTYIVVEPAHWEHRELYVGEAKTVLEGPVLAKDTRVCPCWKGHRWEAVRLQVSCWLNPTRVPALGTSSTQ